MPVHFLVWTHTSSIQAIPWGTSRDDCRCTATLNALLPQHYVGDIGERVYIVQPERSIYLTSSIIEHPLLPRESRIAHSISTDGSADPPGW